MKNKKSDVRKRVLAIRDSLSVYDRNKAAQLLTERICGHQWFYLSDQILAFVSYQSEIDTTELLQEALQKGKKVFVPRVEGENMEFYRIDSLDELVEGYRGIREPDGNGERYVYHQEAASGTLMLMPGTVFDRQRHRIGYGKGFYDRFLADKEELQLRTIGIGYQCQLLDEIPTEEWDLRPSQVICV